ncbi:tetratricopeptide repeat protein [Arcticibacterium luteifluviistationis]|uniref:tetratricopeptide repeat protein n=1 Tax=Arcticibacterium luteifluviistationis TaxID=1784714 RepID=UPI0013A6BD8B|nr:hypothetical protein [Arcticibacterium luteifluviistationis]
MKLRLTETKVLDKKGETALEIIKVYNRNNPDSADKYIGLAKEWLKESPTTKLRARLLLYEANYLQNRGEFKESVDRNHQAIELYESINDIQGLASGYNTLGITYKKQGGDNKDVVAFSNKALMYEKRSLEYYEQANDFDGLLRVYSNIGIIYRDLLEYDLAEASYLKGIAQAESAGYTSYSLAILKANLSQIYLDHYHNYDRAIELLNEALVLYKKNGVLDSQEHAYRNLAYNYTKKKEHQKAIFYANKAVEIAEEVKDDFRKVNAYSSLYNAQKAAGLFEASLLNYEYVNNLKDSLLSIEKTTIIAEMDSRFESVKKEAKIEVLNKAHELDRWKIWGLLAALLALGLFIYGLVQKKKWDALLKEKEISVANENLRVSELELESKKKELTAKVVQLALKNEFLGSLSTEIDTLKNNVDSSVAKASSKITRMIKRDIDGDKQWDKFSEEFSSIHQGFIQSLSEKHGPFSKTEIRLISLLKMNLSSKEIASILGISSDGVKKGRYRLRKKIHIEESQLQNYLLNYN